MTGLMVLMIGGLLWSLFGSLWLRALTNDRFDDPVYKDNIRKLIERNRKFEETKE